MPKCPNPDCGHEYVSGELHCPECFESLPIVATISNQPGAGERPPGQPEVIPPDSGDQDDPFAGLFNDPQTTPPVPPAMKKSVAPAGDIRKLFDPQGLVNRLEPAAEPVNVPVNPVPEGDDLHPAQPSPLPPPKPVPGPSNPAGNGLLKITHGPGTGTEFGLTRESNMIGRWDPGVKAFVEVDLTAVDVEAKVSRKHAQITFANGRYFIEDLGSANGTYVNRGDRLIPGNKAPLNDGDEIIMGKIFLKFILR